MGPRALALLLAPLLWAVAWVPAIAAPQPSEHACPGVPAVVRAASQEDARDACMGARSAWAFFAVLDLPEPEPLRMEVVDSLAREAGPGAAGCYVQESRRALLLSYREFRKRRTWFGVPIERSLYRSLATHEAAHAIAACHFTRATPPIQAKEYVAYVVMFATMDATLRERILRTLPGEKFEHDDSHALVKYLFEPMQFGVDAYRHYRQPGKGRRFLEDVLAGRALVDE